MHWHEGCQRLKCCIKCLNLLSLNKAAEVKDHFDISHADLANFWPATDGSVRAAADRLRTEEKKGKKQELEKLLGWNAAMLLAGPLTEPALEKWVSVDTVHFDTMHAYYSNGIIGCELGHWWELVQHHAQVTLAQLALYAAMWHVAQIHLRQNKWGRNTSLKKNCGETVVISEGNAQHLHWRSFFVLGFRKKFSQRLRQCKQPLLPSNLSTRSFLYWLKPKDIHQQPQHY